MIRGSGPPEKVARRPADAALHLEPLTVRIAMAVQLTGISRSRIYELIQAGDLPVRKVGRSTLIAFADLKRLVASADGE